MDDINGKFRRYSLFFYTITTILLATSILLINPFISVYTRKITDANYIQPIFSYILIFAEFNFVIRYPYSNLVYAKGLFKETKKAAIIEPIINIVLSIILVIKFELIGVAIGTFFSMLIRSVNFIIYASRNILKVNIMSQFKLILVSFLELCFVLLINICVISININSYLLWFCYACVCIIICTILICGVNFMFFKKDALLIFKRRVNEE